MNIAPANPAAARGSDSDMPWLFSATAQHIPNVLALARAGGTHGTVYTYTDSALGTAQGYCSTLAAGARHSNNNSHHHLPLSPPSSLSPSDGAVHICNARPLAAPLAAPAHTLPPSPTASIRSLGPSSTRASSPGLDAHRRCAPVLPLITSVFPYAASSVAAAAHMLEIVTPPDNVLKGFVIDEPSLGRCVFVHLPPTLSAPAPEALVPHFSDVLRPHDPRRDHPVAPLRPRPAAAALDIRESLTALLDLADLLEAAQLLLVLDKDERETVLLTELMHALMFVGGTPVAPGNPVGEWDWDWRRWALVSIEL